MTTYESTEGSIVHIELNTDDLDATKAFYEAAFDWSTETMEMDDDMTYTSWRAPNPPGGGLMQRQEGPYTPPATLFYIQVDDIESAREAITDAGGDLLVEEIAVPEMGVFAVFSDPGGVVEAVWEDRYEGEPPEGGWPRFTDAPEPGSVTHFELYTEDPDATRAFHEAVFGWAFETIDDGAYTMIRPPTPPYGGLMAATDDMPAGTLAYLLAESAEDTCDAIEDAGGRVLREPFEIEGWGTMAVFEAPGGIVQAVWESAPEAEVARADRGTESVSS